MIKVNDSLHSGTPSRIQRPTIPHSGISTPYFEYDFCEYPCLCVCVGLCVRWVRVMNR